MTYDDAIRFWFERINYEIGAAAPKDLKLERMRALLRELGDPHERLRIVHITGTKGKGSTAAFLASVLRESGYRVGLFTSPHLRSVEERIRVNGVPISRVELTAEIERLAPAVRRLERGPWPPPTFFEISTALGFQHFLHRRCDFAVVEVGLGGRFDSTNVCRPLVAVIASVGLDHMAQLGATVEAIAFEKAGIIKPGIPTVCGALEAGPRGVIDSIASEVGSRMIQLGRDFEYDHRAGTTESLPRIEYRSPEHCETYELGLLGEHQAANAALALATLDELKKRGLAIPQSAIATGLRNVNWPARIEVVSRNPTVVFDTAHNVPSVRALVRTLRESLPMTGRKALVFAVSNDKQYPEMLAILAGYFDEFHFTRYGNNPRSVPPEILAKELEGSGKSIRVCGSSLEAWESARSERRPEDLIAVTGSVFLAGELEDAVRGVTA